MNIIKALEEIQTLTDLHIDEINLLRRHTQHLEKKVTKLINDLSYHRQRNQIDALLNIADEETEE